MMLRQVKLDHGEQVEGERQAGERVRSLILKNLERIIGPLVLILSEVYSLECMHRSVS